MAATEVKYPEQVNVGTSRFDENNVKYYTPAYGDQSDVALPGMITSGPKKVITKVASVDVPFGAAVLQATDAESCKLATARGTEGDKALGVAIRSASENIKYPAKMAANVMVSGEVWMEAAGTIAVGAVVYIGGTGYDKASAANTTCYAAIGKALTAATAGKPVLVAVNV